MRGAHRGVWCSKGQRLMEAKLFAAESKRPAQNGRALSAQRKVWVVKRGQETIGVLSPFALAGGHRRLRRQTAAFPPVNTGTPGRRRRPLSTLTSSVKSPPAEAIPSADGIEIKSPCSLGELQGPILFRGSSTHTLLRREGKNRSSNRKQLMNLCPPLAYDATRFGRK